jgi:hypothetical protein
VLLPQLEAEILLADKGFEADQRVIPPAPRWLASPFNFKTAPEFPVVETTSSTTGAFDFIAVKAGSYKLNVPVYNGFAALLVPIRIPSHGPLFAINLSPARIVQAVSVDSSRSL